MNSLKIKINLLLLLLYFFSFAQSKDSEIILSGFKSKNVKIDGSILLPNSSHTIKDFKTIETLQSDLFVDIKSQVRLKLASDTQITLNHGGFNLNKGLLYIKPSGAAVKVSVPELIEFSFSNSDVLLSFRSAEKIIEITNYTNPLEIFINSDDRPVIVPALTKLILVADLIDGEISYDFLLNNKKIPKFKMRNEKLTTSRILSDQAWDQTQNPVKKAKKNSLKAKPSFCTHPPAQFNDCYFVKKDKVCIRYTCNASAQWSLETNLGASLSCPSKPTVLNCDFIK